MQPYCTVSDDHVGLFLGWLLPTKKYATDDGLSDDALVPAAAERCLLAQGASLEMARGLEPSWGPNISSPFLRLLGLPSIPVCPGAPRVRGKSFHQALQLSSGGLVVHIIVPDFLYGRRGEVWKGGIAMADYTPSKTSWSALCPPNGPSIS